MADLVGSGFAAPGLGWIAVTFLVAGLVRGFTRFGSGLIVMPVAAMFLPVPQAIALVMLAGMYT